MNILKKVLRGLKKEYPDIDCFDWNDLVDVLETIHYEKKQPFIFIIDEWDCIFRKYPHNVEEQKKRYAGCVYNMICHMRK